MWMGLVLLVDRLFIAEFDRCVIAYNRTIKTETKLDINQPLRNKVMNIFSKEMQLFLKSKTLTNPMSRSLMEVLVASFKSEQLFISEVYNIVYRDDSETTLGLKEDPKTIQTYIDNKQLFLDFTEDVANSGKMSSGFDYVYSTLCFRHKADDIDVSWHAVKRAMYEPQVNASDIDLDVIILMYKRAIKDLANNYHDYHLRKFASNDLQFFLDSLNTQVTPNMAKAVILHIGGENQFINRCETHKKEETINKNGLFIDEDDAAIFYNDNFELCQEFTNHFKIKNRRPSDISRLVTCSLYRDYMLYQHNLEVSVAQG